MKSDKKNDSLDAATELSKLDKLHRSLARAQRISNLNDSTSKTVDKSYYGINYLVENVIKTIPQVSINATYTNSNLAKTISDIQQMAIGFHTAIVPVATIAADIQLQILKTLYKNDAFIKINEVTASIKNYVKAFQESNYANIIAEIHSLIQKLPQEQYAQFINDLQSDNYIEEENISLLREVYTADSSEKLKDIEERVEANPQIQSKLKGFIGELLRFLIFWLVFQTGGPAAYNAIIVQMRSRPALVYVVQSQHKNKLAQVKKKNKEICVYSKPTFHADVVHKFIKGESVLLEWERVGKFRKVAYEFDISTNAPISFGWVEASDIEILRKPAKQLAIRLLNENDLNDF